MSTESLTLSICVCVCVRVRASIPLHAVCPPGSHLGPGSRHPHVAGAHGDLAGGSHHNLEASSERSRGAHDGLETVTGTQTLQEGEGSKKAQGCVRSCVDLGSVLHPVARMDRLLLPRKNKPKKKKLHCLNLS